MHFESIKYYRTCCFVNSSSLTSLLSVFMSAKATQQRLAVNSATNKLSQKSLGLTAPVEQLLSTLLVVFTAASLYDNTQ